MTADVNTLSSTTFWGRFRNSLAGAVTGAAVIAGAVGTLAWNEDRAVTRAKAIDEGAAVVLTVPAARVDPANDGRLIHVTGAATVDGRLTDAAFNVTAPVLGLRRSVEMYQWVERINTTTEKDPATGTDRRVETAVYERVWQDRPVDSAAFRDGAGNSYRNPPMPVDSTTLYADKASVGAFTLPPALIRSAGGWTTLAIDRYDPLPGSGFPAYRVRVFDGGLYVGLNPAAPQVGDLRVTFEVMEPGPVSAYGRQTGSLIEPFTTSNGGVLHGIKPGEHDAASLFKAEHEANEALTWSIRVSGLAALVFGFSLVFRPLSVLMEPVPVLGFLVRIGTKAFAAVLALIVCLIAIAQAWITVRPEVALPLIGVAGGAFLVSLFFGSRKERAPAA